MKKVFHDSKNFKIIEDFSGAMKCPEGYKEHELTDLQGYTVDEKGKFILVDLVKVREEQAKLLEKKRLIDDELRKMAEERLGGLTL